MPTQREVELQKRFRKFRPKPIILRKVWERLAAGYYTPETVIKCGECGHALQFHSNLGLTTDEAWLYMNWLVTTKRAEWRPQGRIAQARGEPSYICVPINDD